MEDPARTTAHLVMRSLPEAARECGVPEETLRRWIADGQLTAIEIGRSPMVGLAQVAAVRDRREGEAGRPPGGRRSGRRTRALGVANVAAGLAGCVASLGVGPAGLGGPWWLGLCLSSVLVGLLLWGMAAGPGRRGR